MKSFSGSGPKFTLSLVAAMLASVTVAGQPAPAAKAHSPAQAVAAMVLVVRVVPDKNGPAVEIISTRPLVPDVQKLEGPPRLVIDLPNTTNSLQKKQVNFQLGAFSSDPVRAVRIDQFQNRPPVTRVVIDLVKTGEYTWDLAGNLLTVRLRATEAIAPQPASVAALTSEAPAVVVPVSTGGSGVAVSLDRFAAGSTVTAGVDTQILNLGRGGEVRVCPGTTLSVTNSSNGQDLMFGMSTGAFEANYALQSSADSVLTPDFRITLAGPGVFHYAISADSRGNTCMRALAGDAASAIVSELIGDGRYEVKPGTQVIFRSGRLNAMDTATTADCGCPAAPIPVMRAASDVAPANDPSDPVHLAQADEKPARGAAKSTPETPPPPANSQDTQIRIEAPLVFRASDLPPSRPSGGPAASAGNVMDPEKSSARVSPPPSTQPPAAKPHRGFFGKVKGFFASLFS